jgi:hypothetical protein
VPQRFVTTVPQQALYLLNSPFVAEQSKKLATRPEVAKAASAEAKVKALFRLALSRDPATEELAAAVAFVTPKPGWGFLRPRTPFGPYEQLAQTLLMSNEFSFVD